MDSDQLYQKLFDFFPRHPDLMIHLNAGARWQYQVFEGPLDDENIKLEYSLVKENDGKIQMKRGKSPEKPDLILYFTEMAILRLIDGDPGAHEYFTRYHGIMDAPAAEIDLDNKVNKSKIQLFKLGYKKWQAEFKF